MKDTGRERNAALEESFTRKAKAQRMAREQFRVCDTDSEDEFDKAQGTHKEEERQFFLRSRPTTIQDQQDVDEANVLHNVASKKAPTDLQEKEMGRKKKQRRRKSEGGG